jgi:hypothetical protein
LSLNRQRVVESAHLTGANETVTINKSQVISIAISLVYDGSEAAKEILRNIKAQNLNKLNEIFELSIAYPQLTFFDDADIEYTETDTYTCVLVDGSIAINQGGYIILAATFNISGV